MNWQDRRRKENELRAQQFKEDQQPICKAFGCGKKLSPQEYCLSPYCFKHAREQKDKQEQAQERGTQQETKLESYLLRQDNGNDQQSFNDAKLPD